MSTGGSRLEDVWRSVRRLLAMAFPEPWQIRLEAAQYREEERPLIIVDPIGDMATSQTQPTLHNRQRVCAQTFVLTAYPALFDDPRTAREAASAVLQIFDDLVTIGWQDDTGADVGGPLRLPVWNYEGVPLTGPDRGNGPAQWVQLAWAETYNGRLIADPQDDRRFTVPYTLRLSWTAMGRATVGPTAGSFGGFFVADPPVPPPPEPAPPAPVPPRP